MDDDEDDLKESVGGCGVLYQIADAENSDESGRNFLLSFRSDDDSWEWEGKGTSHTRSDG